MTSLTGRAEPSVSGQHRRDLTERVCLRIALIAAALSLFIDPSPAWALPGPEIIVPVSLGIAQFIALVSTLALSWVRRSGVRHITVLIALAAVALVADVTLARGVVGSFIVLGALVVTVVSPRALARPVGPLRLGVCITALCVSLGVLTTLVALGLLAIVRFCPLRYRRPMSAAVLTALVLLPMAARRWSRPLEDSPLFLYDRAPVVSARGSERQRRQLVINVGERGDFSNVRLAADYRLRPADLADALAPLRGYLDHGGELLLAVGTHLSPAQRATLDTLISHGAQTIDNNFATLSTLPHRREIQEYELRGTAAFLLLVPRVFAGLWANAPGLSLHGVPVFRAVDLHTARERGLNAREVSCWRIDRTPTSELTGPAWRQRHFIVHCGEVVHADSAISTLRSVGASVDGLVFDHGTQNTHGRPRLPLSLFSLVVLSALVSTAIDKRVFARVRVLESRWITAKFQQRRAAVELALALGASLFVPFATAMAARFVPLQPRLAFLAAPLILDQSVFIGPVLIVALTAGLYHRVHVLLPRGRTAGFIFVSVLSLCLALGTVGGPFPLPVDLFALTAPLLFSTLIRAGFRRVKLYRLGARPALGAVVSIEDGAALGPQIGAKAMVLSRARAVLHGVVPLGALAWVEPNPKSNDLAARRVYSRLGAVPMIVRSTATDEDGTELSLAGRYESVVVDTDPAPTRIERLANAMATVVASYGTGLSLGVVLCQPRVTADVGGVLYTAGEATALTLCESTPSGAAETTSGEARPTLTAVHFPSPRSVTIVSGESKPDGALVARIVGDAVRIGELVSEGGLKRSAHDVEWLSRGDTHWIVQLRPVTARQRRAWPGNAGDKTPPGASKVSVSLALQVEALRWPWSMEVDRDGLLRRFTTEALPEISGAATCELWASMWRGDSALGRALSELGVRARELPESLVVPVSGALFTLTPALDQVTFALAVAMTKTAIFRRESRAVHAGRRAAECARAFLATAPSNDPETELRRCATVSIQLRFLAPRLLSLRGDTSPPESVHSVFSDALSKARGDLTDRDFIARFGHHAQHDLDPMSARFSELAGDSADTTAEKVLPEPVVDPPSMLDLAWCDYYRAAVHERMVHAVAMLRAKSVRWRDTQRVPSQGVSMPESLSYLDVAAWEEFGCIAERESEEHKAIWVSARKPVEGRAYKGDEIPEDAVERVLVIDAPTPAQAARFHYFKAVVAERGGLLSHAAIVARERNVPAVFGAKVPSDLRSGEHLRIALDGHVERVEPDDTHG